VVFGPAGLVYRLVLGTILLSAMGAAFLFASGWGSRPREDEELTPIEDDDEPFVEEQESRGAVSLGWIFHAIMSAKARIGWFFSTAYRSLVSSGPAPRLSFERQEPNIDGRRAPTLAPQHDEEEDYEEEEEDEEEEEPVARAPRKKPEPRPKKSNSKFELPSVSVLAAPKSSDRQPLSKAELEANSRSLEGVLGDFGVRGEIVKSSPGPVVTLYELEPAPGIKSSRVIGLADDIARSMSALSARVAVVPGRNAIGIELPNAHREKVYLRELLTAKEAADTVAKLPLCLGKTIGGEPVIIDLARTPHMLIAGTTGSGKSVAINTMILSLVYRLRPDQCRLIMVDPKMLELSVYDGIPHLLTPVVTDPKKAVVALKWAVREMEERYKRMAKLGVRNIDGYNARLVEAKAKGEEITRTVHTGFDKESGKAIYEEEKLELDPLPYIVIIVDEMADLMMVAGKDIEGAVQRLAQMARAAGLHVILATQRPSVDVITGTIKANFPTRIAFQVTSKIDSRTILGEMGAEQLLGQGDMLYMAGGGRISRVHGPFASDEEVEKVVRHLKTQGAPEYLEAVTAEEPTDEDGAVFDATGMGGEGGDLFQQAVAIVKRDQKASTSYIQRRLQIGYNRAASLMERMELEGIVGPANHAGKREILVGEEEGGNY
jgi:S-DNA-T family DNA segregation ATPase FtsK/SpoIIIE